MKPHSLKRNAYTMVELMIAVAIIAVIAGIAAPAWMRARENSRKASLVNELRTTSEAFQTYASDAGAGLIASGTGPLNGLPPATASFQQIPAGMAAYMPKKSTWASSPSGGGYWAWLNFTTRNNVVRVRGYSGFISIYNSGLLPSSIQDIDSVLDDGNLSTGSITTTGVDTGGTGTSGGSWIFYGVQGIQ